jgi:hypothetical protein
MQIRVTLLASVAALATACGTATAPIGVCAAPQSISIEVTVQDSVSGAGRADSATGRVVALTYSDSLHHVLGSAALMFGGNRTGTFGVSVERPGYRLWTRPLVAVTQVGPCGNVIPVHLTALLQAAP